ncbi:hypothetical protein ACFLQS_01670 [Actinomycetota bacterium]
MFVCGFYKKKIEKLLIYLAPCKDILVKVKKRKDKKMIIKKNMYFVFITVLFIIILSITSCFPLASKEELEKIIQRDSVAFDLESIPEEVLDQLASHKVVLVGENHFLEEHYAFMGELLRELHSRGFRQILVEWTQIGDWLMDDFVNDGGLEPEWEPANNFFGGIIARAVRDFNRTVPDSEHIQIHGIDITLLDYGGGESFIASLGMLTNHLPDSGPLSELLTSEYDKPDNQTALLEDLKDKLNLNRSELIESWGEQWYNMVAEMIEVELMSIPIRAIRERNYDKSVRMREDAMKQIADRRLESYSYRTLINVGSTHAQKTRLWGTKIEWLGDYLVHKSQVIGGSVIVLWVTPAYIVSAPGSEIPDYDLSTSPENELLSLMSQTWPDQVIFLPTDDPMFSNRKIPINSESEIYLVPPKRYFDIYVLLPIAHRISR